MQEIKTTEEYQKEVEITEEEIESYSGCSEVNGRIRVPFYSLQVMP